MKINLYNMKGLADWIGGAVPPTMDEINILVTAGTIHKMAYQNQKFFEAMEKINNKVELELSRQKDASYTTGLMAAKVILNNALIDKEDEYTLDA